MTEHTNLTSIEIASKQPSIQSVIDMFNQKLEGYQTKDEARKLQSVT